MMSLDVFLTSFFSLGQKMKNVVSLTDFNFRVRGFYFCCVQCRWNSKWNIYQL